MVVAAGSPVTRPELADVTLREALHVLTSVRDPEGRLVHRLEDTHLRGLLMMLGSDERHGTNLLGVVWALLRHPASKAAAADALHLSRPAFYDRLGKAERVLGSDLDDPEVRVSLHVAFLGRALLDSR